MAQVRIRTRCAGCGKELLEDLVVLTSGEVLVYLEPCLDCLERARMEERRTKEVRND